MCKIDLKNKYFTSHLITYLGNKRRLLPFINNEIYKIYKHLGKNKLITFDGFAGSGCISRLLKSYSDVLYSNDLENYTKTINQCYLSNRSDINILDMKAIIDYLNAHKFDDNIIGFIEQNYAPSDDNNIRLGERVFFTNANAKIIDNIRRLIESKIDKGSQLFPLAQLLIKASIHNNTSGVFKGFHKKNNIGHFGGAGENALKRIKQEISLEYPIFGDHECLVCVINGDTNNVIYDIPDMDIAYYDPPYNQHPYGSNYFMLNIINDYDQPAIQQDGVSGIIRNWNKSEYNYKTRQRAISALDDLIQHTRAKYILISYNNEGIIPINTFETMLNKYGDVSLKKQQYNTYRGAKNLGNNKMMKSGSKKAIHVNELLWIVKTK